ncbi:MAG: cysteine peptidase family C39 domain-containing protein, partial [Clostridia bacterium]|nr:cysteine peptidase family C39 domain-containing protein [Clostridia bacterium]
MMDCGPTCLRMVAKFHGRHYALETLRQYSYMTKQGVSLLGISEAAEAIGYRTMGVKVDYQKLLSDAPTPFIAHWNQEHFVVVYKIDAKKVYIADPSHGKIIYTKQEFIKCFSSDMSDGKEVGLCLLLEPTPDFYARDDQEINKKSFSFLFRYIR